MEDNKKKLPDSQQVPPPSPSSLYDFSTFEKTVQSFQKVVESGCVSWIFKNCLQIHLTIPRNLKSMETWLGGSLKSIYWDEKDKTFTLELDVDTIKAVVEKMTGSRKEPQNHPVPPPRPSLNKQPTVQEQTNPQTDDRPPTSHVSEEKTKNDPTVLASTKLDGKNRPKKVRLESLDEGDEDRTISIYDKRQTLELWKNSIGEKVEILKYHQYIRVDKILTAAVTEQNQQFEKMLETPSLSAKDLRGWIAKILPYITQKIKMWGCYALEPQELKLLVQDYEEVLLKKEEKGTGPMFLKKMESKQIESSNTNIQHSVPLSRIDLLTCIINKVDLIIAQDLLRNVAMFPLALPLIIPNLFEENMINIKSLLEDIPIRWKCSNGDIVTNYLFSSPFKLILSMRMGRTRDVGKSCILNHILRRKYTFSSKQEPGAMLGKPLALPGFVEFIPLTEETCSPDLWKNVIEKNYSPGNESIILLANMHGNPEDHPEVLNTMIELATGVVVFAMPEVDQATSSDLWNKLLSVFGPDIPYLDVVDSNVASYQASTVVSTRNLNSDETLQKVRNAIEKSLVLKKAENYDFLQKKKVAYTPEICSTESKKLEKFLQEMPFKNVKSLMFQSHSRDSTEFNSRVELLRRFCKLLQRSVRKRMMGLLHLERELTKLTNSNTMATRVEIIDLESDMLSATSLDISSSEKARKKEMLMKLINQKLNLLNENNLGLEHFYRALGLLYEHDELKTADPILSCELEYLYAELVINGNTIELLNGESSKPAISGGWFIAICENISRIFPNLRIFVVSVIGLQSSGKSTLLNALFGCKFAVSVGRCTRGLFMRLLFLEDDLKDELKTDAILLIDMEGLAAPEKVNDPAAEEKDRIMTTFVMGISNLILVNIAGEALNSMTDILQIAVVAMARLIETKLSPDIFVVQHLSEKNTQKLTTTHAEFIKALERAIKLTESEGVSVGIQDSDCLRNLMQRASRGNAVKAFGPYRNGEFINSPPSAGYHESVVELYKSILSACKECNDKQDFNRWTRLLEEYLDAVLSEDLAVRFKNLVDICEHLVRGEKIKEAKEAISKCFLRHAENLKPIIRLEIQKFQTGKPESAETSKLEAKLTDKISNGLLKIPQVCSSKNIENGWCSYCENAIQSTKTLQSYVEGKLAEEDTMATIAKFTEDTRNSQIKILRNMMGASLLQQGCSKEFQEIITNCILKFDPDKMKSSKSSFDEQNQTVEKVWKELKSTVAQKYPPYETVEDRMMKDFATLYANSPDAAARFGSPELPDLENRMAYRSKTVIQELVPENKPILKRLEFRDCLELKRRLIYFPEQFIKIRNVQHYNSGIMITIEKEISNAIENFEKFLKKRLLGDFKWECTIYAMKKFLFHFQSLEKECASAQHPLMLLERDEEIYKKLIHTRIYCGFNAVGEGYVIAEWLLKAIVERVERNIENWRIEKILEEPWIINSEKVRLKFLGSLAKQVDRGVKEKAVAYFMAPESIMTLWFESLVDRMYVNESEMLIQKYFDEEVNEVLVQIKNRESMDEIKQFLDEYFAKSGSISYEPTPVKEDEHSSYLHLIKNTALNRLLDKKEEAVKRIRLGNPSESELVSSRLGCTEQCYWCGALCWGQKGHENNKDSTKNHHACHQPSGLFGVVHKKTAVLVEIPCHDRPETELVYWGDYKKSGLRWKDAKEHPDFKTWMFGRHSKTSFSQLMYWFFTNLNKELARVHGAKPAPKSAFRRERYKSISCIPVKKILSSISIDIQ